MLSIRIFLAFILSSSNDNGIDNYSDSECDGERDSDSDSDGDGDSDTNSVNCRPIDGEGYS